MTSLKHEIETWNEGVQLFDQEHFDEAIEVFESIGDSAKYHFNIGVVLMTMGDFESATVAFSQATKMDKYLSVAYFQNGIAHVALENYEISVKCFNLAYFYLRGNDIIDYTQLGLDFKLYKCQILYNLALCRIELGELRLAMGDLEQAKLAKQTKDHDIIDEAYKDRGVNHTVMTIPRGVLYRPSASKVRDSKKKDYLGNARVIAEVNPAGDFKGFKGTSAWKMQMSGPTNIASSGSNPLSTPQVSNAGRRYSAWINDLSTKQKELEAIRATPAMPPPKALGRSNTEVRPSMGRGRSPSPAAPVASVVPVAPPAPPAPPAPAVGGGNGGNGMVSRGHIERPKYQLDAVERLNQELKDKGRISRSNSAGYTLPTRAPTRSPSTSSMRNNNNTNNDALHRRSPSSSNLSPNRGTSPILLTAKSSERLTPTANTRAVSPRSSSPSPSGSRGASPIMYAIPMNTVNLPPPSSRVTSPTSSASRNEGVLRRAGSQGHSLQRPNARTSALNAANRSQPIDLQYTGNHASQQQTQQRKFRVKCHFPESPKPLSVAVTLDQHSTHKELQNILMDKLQLSHPPILKYKDGEDILSIIGDDDWMTALDVHRPIEGAAFRMDIWCYDDW